MNIRDLEYLVALDELRNFRKASERCHVTQPTLSGQLRKLEEHLGVLLVERTKRKVILTPVGKEVVRRARMILQEVEQIEEISVSFKDPMQGKLRIGLIPTLGPYLLPFMIPAMIQEYPRLQLFLYEEQTHILLNKLNNAELDAIVLALPVSNNGFYEIELFDEPFLLALPRGHELSIKESVSLSDLSAEKILLLEDGHCLRDQALEVCMMAGATENPEFQGTSLETLRHMVSAGMGVTLMPYFSVYPNSGSNPPLSYLHFEDPVPSRKIGLLFRESSQRKEGFPKRSATVYRIQPTPRSVQNSRDGKGKAGDFHLKAFPLVIDHLITAVHRPHFSFEMGTTGVFEFFSRIQNGLFSHHTFSFDFFRFTIAVGDNPMATE